METALPSISTFELFDRVIAGLSDEHDIRVLSTLMLTKLLILSPSETLTRLPSIGSSFKVILSYKPKDSAVKQELEKIDEVNRGVLRVTLLINKKWPNARTDITTQGSWGAYWAWAKAAFQPQLKVVQDEEAAQERAGVE
jgi:cullin-associated NEDD8-dissociated protein 1